MKKSVCDLCMEKADFQCDWCFFCPEYNPNVDDEEEDEWAKSNLIEGIGGEDNAITHRL